MDYKKVIKSQGTRIKIMQMLSFLPDPLVLSLQYKIKTGRKLNLKNPQRYTEKLQWYKLYYKNPVMKKCVDKYEVREYVKNKGLENILNENYGVYEEYKEIDFKKFPEKVVFKDTLGGGSTAVVVFDKSSGSYSDLREKCDRWVNSSTRLKSPGREWPYDNVKHRIVVDKYLEQSDGDLADYKFYCFNGKVYCFYVRTNYSKSHLDGKMAFFDRNKKSIPGLMLDYCDKSNSLPQLPNEINEMMEYAEILSADFPHVRVDFYDVDGKIYFGELTFYNASGYFSFTPDDFDYEFGKAFVLPRQD